MISLPLLFFHLIDHVLQVVLIDLGPEVPHPPQQLCGAFPVIDALQMNLHAALPMAELAPRKAVCAIQ